MRRSPFATHPTTANVIPSSSLTITMQEGPSEVTVATFGLLRGPASRLMTLPSISAANAQEVARDLNALVSVLTAMPDPELHFDTKLISYIQHALNHVLQLCQKFLLPEKRFDFVVEAWCRCLEFILRLPDGYAVIIGSNWKYSQVIFDVLFRAVDGLPIKEAPLPSRRSSRLEHVKKDKMPDEVRLVAMRCLVLALPLDKTAPRMLDDITDFGSTVTKSLDESDTRDRATRTDKDKEVQGHLLESSGESFMGQLVLVFLDAAKDAHMVALRKTALDGVMKLIYCLETPQRVATWFPGIAAGLIKAMVERGIKEHHSVLVGALKVWTYMVILVLKDLSSSDPLKDEAMTGGSGLGKTLTDMYNAKGRSSPGSAAQSPNSTQPSQGGYGSDAWLSKMDHGLQTLFKQITTLRSHPSWIVRLGFADMSFSILKDCQRSLLRRAGGTNSSWVACFLLETLIGGTQDDYDDIRLPSIRYLALLNHEYGSTGLSNLAKEVLREHLIALPRVLHGADEAAKQDKIRVAQGLVLFMGPQMELMINLQNILTYEAPWINILAIEQLDQHNMDKRGGILSAAARGRATIVGSEEERWATWIQTHKDSDRKFGFPRRIHLHLREQSTSDAFLGFLRQLGSTTEVNIWTEEMISHLQRDSRNVRDDQGWFDAATVSCVLLLNQILLGAHGVGIATFGDINIGSIGSSNTSSGKIRSSKKRQRHVRRAARGVLEEYLAIMVDCSQMSLDAKWKQEAAQHSTTSTTRDPRATKMALARLFGMGEEEGLFDEQPEAQIYDYNTDVMLRCILLEGVASIAVVLGGTEFEMELVRVLYILLEHLGDQDSALVRDTAEATLEHVAFICNHDSIGDLIQANYDYVIQQVSQRIAFLSSNPKTPQVLWALIHVVGAPAVSMLEDSVTEIFDALDHWKNQEDQVGEGLLKSLCEIVKVMAQAVTASKTTSTDDASSDSKRDSGVMMSEGFEFSLPDKPSKEVIQFAKTYRTLVQGVDVDDKETEKFKKETENMTPDQVREYFMKLANEAKENEERLFGERQDGDLDEDTEKDQDDDTMSFGDLRAKLPKPSKESQPEPPTKHQALCLRILDKAGYFLTASSPRMRILALEIIQASVIVLKDRPQELNPAIHAFWPSIVGRVLKRSDMEVFYVSLRAIEVVTLLAENCSDFLGRHLLDDIWPFILKALRTWSRPASSLEANAGKTTYYGIRRVAQSSQSATEVAQHRTGRRQRMQGKGRAGPKVFTLEHRLQMATLESVAKIVRRVRIPVQQMWDALLLARDMVLDQEYLLHWDVRVAAADVVRSMAVAGHGDSVFLALDELMQQNGERKEQEEDEGLQMCLDILALLERDNL
ncbi:TEL2-interacting protein 1 [Dissophora globulifera]|uniref:TEL2-interacting protein 1 n=1 Tax=Dissophora globulifera TaxID=979702 RepID=A0A9P6UV43_9FUNG|nr:TEL2-interacting protein 1 [Dissophora globulifera]